MSTESLTEKIALALLDTPIQVLLEPKKPKKTQHLNKESLIGIIGAILAMQPEAAPEVKGPDARAVEDLDNYNFLFPAPKLREAMIAFDQCGEIKVEIIRKLNGGTVRIGKLIADIAPGLGEQPPAPKNYPSEPAPAFDTLGVKAGRLETTPSPSGEPARDVRRVMMLMPTNRDFNSTVNEGIMGCFKQAVRLSNVEDAKMYFKKDTVIDRARNVCADVFLKSNADWSFWLDSDMIVPNGNPGWFHERTGCKYGPEFSGLNALDILTRGPEKFVGAVYTTRDARRLLCNSAGLNPKTKDDEEIVERLKQGPYKKRETVEWLGFGCVAVHRSVFEDIMKTQPELASKKAGEPWNFFTGELTCSEDVAFARRAAKAGHRASLDCGIIAAHVGLTAYLP